MTFPPLDRVDDVGERLRFLDHADPSRLNDFATMNGIYATYFKDNPPARSTVEVARLPKDCLFEIECIALV